MVLVQFEKSLVGAEPYPLRDDLTFIRLDESNFEELLSKGLIPDSWSLRMIKKVSRRTYDRQKQAVFDDVHRNLAKGDPCFVGLFQGKPVCWTWVCVQKEKYEPVIDKNIVLEPGTSLLYSGYAYPGYQGKGIGTAMMRQGINYQIEHGYTRSIGFIENDNLPSKGLAMKNGYRPTKIYKCVRVFKYSKNTEEAISDAHEEKDRAH